MLSLSSPAATLSGSDGTGRGSGTGSSGLGGSVGGRDGGWATAGGIDRGGGGAGGGARSERAAGPAWNGNLRPGGAPQPAPLVQWGGAGAAAVDPGAAGFFISVTKG